MHDLEQAINDRRSTRMFLPDKPVSRKRVEQALDVAIRAPTNSNVQPWHLRRDLGAKVYGSMGIARDDTEGRRIAVLRNSSACSCSR
jgi:nitroreductase